jgi:hypothetical protein
MNFEVMPLLYVKNYQNEKVLQRWAIRLAQTVAAKYLIVRTLNGI